MRTFVISSLVLMASFGMSHFVFAASDTGGGSPAFAPSDHGFGASKVTPPPGSNTKLANPLKGGDSLQSFLRNILDFVIKIGTVVVILMMVLVGYKFVAAQGAPDKIKEARDMLLWTVVGALILLGSQAIAFGIEKTVQALSVGK